MKNENIILINKPKGITSFDVIRKLRKKMGVRKMGHAGTLDPMATGLMIIGVGEGTKKLNDYIKLDKDYIADILLGTSTDTGDLEGEVIDNIKLYEIDADYIQSIINAFEGDFMIKPPVYSAIKKDGKPMYKYAREGKSVDIESRKMTVYKSDFLGIEEMQEGFVVRVFFSVASGVYIRSLVTKIGEILGVPATLSGLERTRIGDFKLEKAVDL